MKSMIKQQKPPAMQRAKVYGLYEDTTEIRNFILSHAALKFQCFRVFLCPKIVYFCEVLVI